MYIRLYCILICSNHSDTIYINKNMSESNMINAKNHPDDDKRNVPLYISKYRDEIRRSYTIHTIHIYM